MRLSRPITRGATSQLIEVRFSDLSQLNGIGKTGLTTASFTSVYYHRGLAASTVAVTLDGTMTLGTWKASGFVEVDSTHLPGLYQIGLPDLMVGTADTSPYVTVVFVPTTASGAPQVEIVIPLVAFDLQTATQSVSVTQWNGTNVSSPATAGIPDVNVKNINNVSASSVTTVNANVGTTQPQNFTGTGASALVKVDVTDIATAAVSTGTAQLGVNVVNIGGGASQGAAGYVGTDQSKIANPTATVDLSGTTIKNVDNAIANVTLVATATNLTNAPTNGDFTTAMKASLNAATPSTTVSGWGAGAVQAFFDSVVTFATAASVGKLWNDFLSAIKAKTDTLGAATIQVRSVTTDAGTIYLTAGDDYLAADGRSLDFTFSGMPSFVAASCRISFTSSGGSLIAAPVAGTVLSATSLRFELTHTVTATLTQAEKFEIEVTLADASIITPIPLKDGKAVIAQQAG